MKEAKGNLWSFDADAYCILTNGNVMANGENIMGGGCALEARESFPGIGKRFGDLLKKNGHHVQTIWEHPFIISFPTKNDVWKNSDIDLIKRSAEELALLRGHLESGHYYKFTSIVLPRPGCGLGGLKWEDVKPVIEPILDDRFTVVTF